MDNLYSSFYLYKKYEIIGDELIDLGITSIDADGTQEPVMKEECDPACGCPEPIYRWVQTEDTVCVGESAGMKYSLVLSDSSVVSAECDSTSAVTSGEVATQYSGSVVSAVIGDCVTSIGNSAFYSCRSLSSITIPDSVTIIDNFAFSYCSGLTSIELPDSVATIGANAFRNCTSLESINIPSGVTNIDVNTFRNSSGLTSIEIPSGVTSIGNNAFNGCSGLASVTCNAITPPSLGNTVFDNSSCPIYVPCESVSAYQSATNWSDYANRIEGIPPCGQPTPTACTCSDFTFSPTEFTVSSAATSVTFNYSGCTKPIFNRITPQWCFVDSTTYDTGATTGSVIVNISANTSSARTTSLAPKVNDVICQELGINQESGIAPTPTIDGKYKLTLSDSSTVTAECDSTSSVTSGEVATQYSGSVTPALAEAEIGDCVKTIGGGAFIRCSGLTSVTISDNVTSISGFAFGYCKSLVTCNIGTGVTKMGSSIFQSCHSLTGITIPNGVTSIEMWTFNQCRSLTSITIPNGVTSIGDYAFGYCTGLTSIELPDSATSIGNYAFWGCSGLTSIDIPNSVTSIGQEAFRLCYGLQSIDIPDSVTSIGEGAFSNCSGLTSISCLAITPPTLGSGAFNYTNNCPIYVPAASLTDYQTAWSTYASRIQAIP